MSPVFFSVSMTTFVHAYFKADFFGKMIFGMVSGFMLGYLIDALFDIGWQNDDQLVLTLGFFGFVLGPRIFDLIYRPTK